MIHCRIQHNTVVCDLCTFGKASGSVGQGIKPELLKERGKEGERRKKKENSGGRCRWMRKWISGSVDYKMFVGWSGGSEVKWK